MLVHWEVSRALYIQDFELSLVTKVMGIKELKIVSKTGSVSETENFKKYMYYTFKIKERRDGLTQKRVNGETKSLWYITEWEVNNMNV